MENKEMNDSKTQSENAVLLSKINNARKEGKANGALIASIIGLVLLLALGVTAYSLYKRDHNNQLSLMENQKISFTQQLNQRDSTLNDWLTSFNEIENNLRMIKEKEKLITVNSTGSEVSKDKRNLIMEDIRSINTLLDENKKKIAQLNAQLRKSGTMVEGLQKKITELEASMQQYENDITLLKGTLDNKNFEIGQLNERVVALNDTLSSKKETINKQTYQLNKAFMVSGTFKELRDKGLLSKEGGFLGIGRNESIKENFSDSIFTEININELNSIPVNSRKVKLVTEHPQGSYEVIMQDKDHVASISIKNPAEFWKISRYAVVELIK